MTAMTARMTLGRMVSGFWFLVSGFGFQISGVKGVSEGGRTWCADGSTNRLRPALRTRNPKPETRNPNCGSALIIALWTIALLAMLVMSFALDAMLEGKVNVYVRQRRQVDYLTQSGISIAEMLLLSYKNASSSSTSSSAPGAEGGQGVAEDVDDKWLQAKLDLQHGSAKVDAYAVEPGKPENGLVSVEITSADANKWPINLLVKGDIADRIWENILNAVGLPMEYQEEVVDSWYDWLDADDRDRPERCRGRVLRWARQALPGA